MTAPSSQKQQELYIKGVNLKKSLRRIKDIFELADLATYFIIWRGDIIDFAEGSNLVSKIANVDEVNWLLSNGGVGVYLNSKRSDDIILALNNDIEKILLVLDNYQLPTIIGEVKYDDATKTLHLGDVQTKITDRAISRETELLKVLFSNTKMCWDMDMIIDHVRSGSLVLPNDYPKNVYYNAAKKLNLKLSKVLNGDEFLIVTTKSIRIDPKYL